jgi:hypothetical protein
MCTAETNCGFIFHSPINRAAVSVFELVCCRGAVNARILKERLDKMTTNEVATRPPLAHDQVPRCWLPTGYNAKSSGTLRTIHILYNLSHST